MRAAVWKMAYVVAMATWGLLSYATLGDYLRQGTLFARTIENKPYINDFVNTYSASQLANRCLESRVDVYDPKVQDAQVKRLIAPVVPENPFYFQYPPHYFALVLPLSWLPLPGAWLAWNLLFDSAAVTALLYLARAESQGTRLAVVALSLASYPWWQSVQLGQTSLFIFPFAVLFFELLRGRRFVGAGIVTALLSIKLQYLPAFGLIGLICGGWRYVASAAVALGGLIGISALLLGVDNVARFPNALLTGETGQFFTGVNPFVMQNFRGQLWLLMHGESGATRAVSLFVFALAMAGLGYLWWREKRAGENGAIPDERFDWLRAVSVLIMITTSVHTHVQDYIFSAIACYFVWRHSGKQAWLGSGFSGFSWLLFFLQPLLALVLIQPFFLWAVLMLVLVMKPQRESTGA